MGFIYSISGVRSGHRSREVTICLRCEPGILVLHEFALRTIPSTQEGPASDQH
jgi:hypothetical protein